MSQGTIIFHGKGKISFLILYVYLLAMLILQNSLNESTISKTFYIFMAIIAFFLTFFILSVCRSLSAFSFPALRDSASVEKSSLNKTLFCGIGFIFLFAVFISIFLYSKYFPEINVHFFIQSLFFSAAVSYLAFILYRNGSTPVFLLGLCLYLFFQLSIQEQTVFQDGGFVLTALSAFLTAYYIQIVCSRGKWFQNSIHIAVFFLTAALCVCTVRLAFLFVLPLTLTAVFFAVKNKRSRITLSVFILAAGIILCGFSTFSRKEDLSQRIPDTIGLPLSIWCNVMRTYPSALPEETQEVMYSLMPQEVYDSYDLNGGFYSVSDSEQIQYDKIASLSFTDILNYTFQCFRFAPNEAMATLAYTTHSLWEIVIGTHGPELLAMLITAAAFLTQGRISILHICPLFLYSFGSMLCLGGPRPDLYFLNTLLCPAIIFLMAKDKTEFNSTARHKKRTGIAG